MKLSIGVALGSALLLLVAGCAATDTAPGAGAAPATGAVAAVTGSVRDFNLQVKCPGVAYLKKQGWSDEQIVAQLNMQQDQIPVCIQWVESQPKGFVPPPPGGAAPAQGEKPAEEQTS
jgi:hypothetical protein